MKRNSNNGKITKETTLSDFNNRDKEAFAYFYNKMYKEFHLYASRLYVNTLIEPADAVQDVFLIIWQNRSLHFETLANLKGYVFITLKNRYKNHLERLRVENTFVQKEINVDNNFVLDMFENSFYTHIEQILGLLPADYAQILVLHIEGWSADEISKTLNISKQTIYNKKHKAIEMLKEKLTQHKGKFDGNIFLIAVATIYNL